MSRNIKQSVEMNLEGNLQQKTRDYGRSLERMGRSGRKHLGGLSRTATLAGRSLDKLGNRYTGLLTGAAVTVAVKQVGDLSERYTRLGIQANISDDKVQGLKRSVFEVSQSPDIRVDPSQMLGAIEAIVEKTGDLEFARANIRNIGLAIQATGATGSDVGELLAEFQKQGIKAPGEVLKTIDILNNQGKAGAFTLQNLASLGPRVVSAYNAAGRSGVTAMREMGAALQVIRQGTGSSEQAATAFEAVMRALADPKKIEQLKELGNIEVFDAEALKAGRRELKPINQLMVDIVKAAGGDQVNLGAVFDAEAMRAFNTASAEFKRTGGVDSIDQFYQVSGDGKTTLQDSARAANEFNASMTSLATSWSQFADNNLTQPVRELADLLNSMNSDQVQLAYGAAKWAVAIGGAAIVLRKVWRLGQSVSGVFSKGSARGGRGGGGLGGGAGGPVPVYVVNGGGGAGGRGGRGRSGGKLASMGKAAGAAGLLYGAWEVGTSIGDQINSTLIEGTAFQDALGSGIANVLALFGNDQAKNAVRRNERFEKQQEGRIKLEVESVAPVRVKEMAADGMELDVDAGQVLRAP